MKTDASFAVAGSRIAVTGSTGFVGRHLCARLLGSGASVLGLTRQRDASLPLGVQRIIIDGLSDGRLARSLAGVDAVVHLAARVHVPGRDTVESAAEFQRVNVQGTAAVLAAAKTAGVRTFVFASSVKAVGESNEQPWTEDKLPRPSDAYGQSKLDAERLVGAIGASGSMRTAVLRFPLVYGEGVGGNFRRLVLAVARRNWIPLGGIANRRSLLYVDNLTDAVERVIATSSCRETFFVSDDDDLSTPGLIVEIGAALGRRPRLVRAPVGLMRVATRLGVPISGVLPWRITPGTYSRLFGSLTVDVGRLRAATGYSPRFTAAQGLAIAARSIVSNQPIGSAS